MELLVEGLLESSLVFSLKMSPFYIKILFFPLNPRSPVFFLAHPYFLLSIFLSISCSVLLPSKLLILYKYLSISVQLLYCFMFNQRSPSQPPPLQGGGVLSHVSHAAWLIRKPAPLQKQATSSSRDDMKIPLGPRGSTHIKI